MSAGFSFLRAFPQLLLHLFPSSSFWTPSPNEQPGGAGLWASFVLIGGLLLFVTPSPVSAQPDEYGTGSAVVLDGSGDYVALPNDPAINTGGPYATRTIELWFKAADVSGSTEQVIYEEGGITKGFSFYVRNGTLYAGAWNKVALGGSWFNWISTSNIESGNWHHVALVFDYPDGSTYAYLDGSKFGSQSPGSDVETHVGEIGIGANHNGTRFVTREDPQTTGEYFEGQIDQVRLWDGALSAREVQARAKRTIAPESAAADSLIAAYRFDSGSGTTVPDYSTTDGTAQDGSFAGDPQWAAYSGARFGRSSAVPVGPDTTLGPNGGTVSVAGLSTQDTLQVYRYGTNDGPLIDGGDPAESFSGAGADRRLNVVWGLNAVGSFSSADVTFDFSGITGVNDPSNVVLLKREGPGDPWTDVTSTWTVNAQEESISKTGVSSFSQYAIGGTGQTLPVELAAFEATRTDSGIRLNWTTASETGNAGFRIQRKNARTNSDAEWQTLGRRDGAGTTTASQTYTFKDDTFPYDADSLAYRLKQVDTDGTVHFSSPVAVSRGSVARVRLSNVYPNPAAEQVTLQFAVPDNVSTNTRIMLYDVLGRRVRTVPLQSVGGRGQRTLNVSGLSSGTYVLRLEAGGVTQSQQLTVVQ